MLDRRKGVRTKSMRERTKTKNLSDVRMLSIDEIGPYMGLGKSTARKLCQDINAERHVGKRVLYDRKVIDDYFDTLHEKE